MIAATNKNRAETFDRLNPDPPSYLSSMRGMGGRRRFLSNPSMKRYCWFRGPVFSSLLDAAHEFRPKNRNVFLDAGCGNSPDADLAPAYGFKRGIKVDLFEPTDPHGYTFGNARFVQGDICKLSDYIEPSSIDMIGCHAVLDLMCADDRVLFYGEAWDILRPGGVVAIRYQFLVHGYNDWNDWQERREVQDIGFELLLARTNLVIAVKSTEVPQ